MTASTGLTDDDIAAVVDPIERGRILRAIAASAKTLTPAQSAIWHRTVAELAGDGLDERKTGWIARQFGVGASRIRQILGRARATTLAPTSPEVTP